MTKVIRKGIEGLVLMSELASNFLSQMIAPAAVQENSSWWKTSIDLWLQDSQAHLLSLKSQKFLLRKCLECFSFVSKISRQLFIDNCHLKFSRLIFQIV